MSMRSEDVERMLKDSGLERTRSTKKLVEFRSPGTDRFLYFRSEIGLPGYIRVVIHPTEPYEDLTALAGVEVNSPKEYQHGSNMTVFPKRKNKGVDEIHYGRALNIDSLCALERFAKLFRKS